MAGHALTRARDGTYHFPKSKDVAVQPPSKLRPTHNFVHCRALPLAEDKASLIIRPDTADLEFYLAEVLAVGPGIYTPNGERVPVCCKPGDHVIVHVTRIAWVDDQLRRRVDAPGVAFVIPDDGIMAVLER